MRAINHAVTGAVIGLSITNPLIAIPTAIVSHFVLDAVPHHGNPGKPFTSRLFALTLLLDALLCLALIVFLFFAIPLDWILPSVCAFAAASPDFMSIGRFVRAHKGGDTAPQLWITRFASKIQWCERPWGWIVEVVYFLVISSVLYRLTLG